MSMARQAASMIGLVLLLIGCTSTNPTVKAGVSGTVVRGSTVLLMEPDIVCTELGADDSEVKNAEWTRAAEESVAAALADFMAEHDTRLVPYDVGGLPPERLRQHQPALQALGGVATPTAAAPAQPVQVSTPRVELLAPLREDFGADYALSVFLRQSFQTPGHLAMRYSLGLLLGPIWAPMPGTGQFGYASLVDLRTGEVIWVNSIATGGETMADVRTRDAAKATVAELMTDCPI